VLKKTSAAGSVAIAATAGILFTGSPASAQGPALVQGHHRHHFHVVSSNRNRNLNLNKNRVVVRVRVHNRNNNVAVANNRGFRDVGFRRDGFFRGSGCCGNRSFDDDFGGGRFGGDFIRSGDVSVSLAPSRFGRDRDKFDRGRFDGDDGDDD
jgi:hypothetical protein